MTALLDRRPSLRERVAELAVETERAQAELATANEEAPCRG